MCLDMNVPFLGKIPLDPLIGKCCDEGKSFIKEYPDSLAAIAYKSLIKGLTSFFNLLKRLTNFKFKFNFLELQLKVEN